MLVDEFTRKDKHGCFLDARTTPYQWLVMNDLRVIKVRVFNKDWYCISQFAKSININPNSKQLAKKLNKVNDGTSVRIWLFGQKKMWFSTEKGLHQIFDDYVNFNSLNIKL